MVYLLGFSHTTHIWFMEFQIFLFAFQGFILNNMVHITYNLFWALLESGMLIIPCFIQALTFYFKITSPVEEKLVNNFGAFDTTPKFSPE
ncbi:hypothetical protein ACJX0J_025976, partial [Zea mays]